MSSLFTACAMQLHRHRRELRLDGGIQLQDNNQIFCCLGTHTEAVGSLTYQELAVIGGICKVSRSLDPACKCSGGKAVRLSLGLWFYWL